MSEAEPREFRRWLSPLTRFVFLAAPVMGVLCVVCALVSLLWKGTSEGTPVAAGVLLLIVAAWRHRLSKRPYVRIGPEEFVVVDSKNGTPRFVAWCNVRGMTVAEGKAIHVVLEGGDKVNVDLGDIAPRQRGELLALFRAHVPSSPEET